MNILADILMIMHLAWILFMVLGLPLGLWLGWPKLRWVHFGGMMLTAFFALTGMYCPLTVLEEVLRLKADNSFRFNGGFLFHYLSPVLYPQIKPFILRGATIFWGVLTVLSMLFMRSKREASNT